MVAIEVAEMETTIQHLREEVIHLERRLARAEAENGMYRAINERLTETAHDDLVRSVEVKMILQSVSDGLIAGLKRMEDRIAAERLSRAEEKAARLQEQETALGVGGEDKPEFIANAEAADIDAETGTADDQGQFAQDDGLTILYEGEDAPNRGVRKTPPPVNEFPGRTIEDDLKSLREIGVVS